MEIMTTGGGTGRHIYLALSFIKLAKNRSGKCLCYHSEHEKDWNQRLFQQRGLILKPLKFKDFAFPFIEKMCQKNDLSISA
jgi:UDP-N-acetylglucosamine:LPS N-acetylglucosamine transferase